MRNAIKSVANIVKSLTVVVLVAGAAVQWALPVLAADPSPKANTGAASKPAAAAVQEASKDALELQIPEAWGGELRKIAFSRQIGVTSDTIECGEKFQLLENQPDAPKMVCHLVGKRTVTVWRPVFMKFDFKPQGREIHVAVNGDDSAAGSKAAPMKTINGAMQKAQPGDHVIVGAGTYYEQVKITKKGTADKPIVLRAADGARPRIELPKGEGAKKPGDSKNGGYHTTVVQLQGVEYVQIHGLEIVGSYGREDEWLEEFNSAVGIKGEGIGKGIIISENYIHNNVHCGLKLETKGNSPFLVVGNVIYNNGASRHHDHGTYQHGDDCVYLGNVFLANGAFAFHLYGTAPKHNIIRGNLVLENGYATLFEGGENVFVNNVIANSARAGIMMWGPTSYKNHFINNVFYQNDNYEIERVGYGNLPLPTATFANNCFWPKTGTPMATDNTPESVWKTPGTVMADPKFKDAAHYDFRLSEGSPCLNAGLNIGQPYEGAGPDIGAFEQ